MTYAAGQAERNESPILHAAIALAPAIRALGDEIEQGRRIPASVVHAMKDAGIFGMPMPRAGAVRNLIRSPSFASLRHWPWRTARSAGAP